MKREELASHSVCYGMVPIGPFKTEALIHLTVQSVHIRLLSFELCVCVCVCVCVRMRAHLCEFPSAQDSHFAKSPSPWRWPTSHSRTPWKISQGFLLWLQHSSSSPSYKSFFLHLLFTRIWWHPFPPKFTVCWASSQSLPLGEPDLGWLAQGLVWPSWLRNGFWSWITHGQSSPVPQW